MTVRVVDAPASQFGVPSSSTAARAIIRTRAPDALAFAAITAVYLTLSVSTIASFGVLWDEQTDIEVARSYVFSPPDWLEGSVSDPTQTRLPMYTVAAVFALLGRSDLHLARLVSCFVSVLTLLAVYLYARAWFGRGEALLASTLLATSPLFLAFSRVALTEGDAFVTAAVAWSMLAVARAVDSPTVGRTALSGVALGLAVSAKFPAISLTPVVALARWVVRSGKAAESGADRTGLRVVLLGGCILATVGFALAWFQRYHLRLPEQSLLAATVWLIGAVVYASTLFLLARAPRRIVGPVAQAFLALAIAGATFLLIPPVHLTNPVHVSSILEEIRRSSRVEPALVLEAASLHGMTVLIKPSLLVGIVVCTCVLLAASRWRRDPRVRLPLLCVALYVAFLLKMRLAQTFYTMPIFPWMLVLAAERLVTLWRRHKTVAVGLIAACFISVALDLRTTYPHYQLNGYQWVGARYVLGRSTLAYRGVVQVNSDGAEQALDWVNRHVPPGAQVKTYVRPDHIIRAVTPRPSFTLIDGLRPPSRSIDGVDYVVTTLHGDIRPSRPGGGAGPESVFEYPYDRDALVGAFDPVFRVRRPFGLEVATVWQKKGR